MSTNHNSVPPPHQNKKDPAPKKRSRKDYAAFPDKTWSSPKIDPTKKGSQDQNEVFRAVGAALSAWERAEEELTNLLVKLCRISDRSADGVFRAFGAIESNAVRRKAVEAAAEVYFGRFWSHSEIRFTLDALLDAIQNAAFIRNEIAHGKVVQFIINDAALGVHDLGAFLCAPTYKTNHQLPYLNSTVEGDLLSIYIKSSYRYNVDDITGYITKFIMLMIKITEYSNSIDMVDGFPANVWKFLPVTPDGQPRSIHQEPVQTPDQPNSAPSCDSGQ